MGINVTEAKVWERATGAGSRSDGGVGVGGGVWEELRSRGLGRNRQLELRGELCPGGRDAGNRRREAAEREMRFFRSKGSLKLQIGKDQ